ncbi:putative disease resistance RPP13-like protein 3 [Typha angustifolia]|uniref:putative disease resistance RPP13-like protein 3 n=1 Tax=Typha angustifolia TaxID=59011 RepID=UPI003C2F9BFE
MADTAVTFVVSKLGELASREAAVLLEVGKKVMLLRDKLEWLQTFLKDADQKRRHWDDQYLGVWVRQTRDVAFEVEDALDEFFLKVDQQSLGYWSCTNALFKCWKCCTKELSVRHNLSNQIDNIQERLEKIDSHRTKHNLESIPSSWTVFSTTEIAPWSKLEEHVVGFDNHVHTLTEKLVNRETDGRRAVVSIMGDIGTGKTTLAKEVYKSPKIKKMFEYRAWVHVPVTFKVKDLLSHIFRQLSSNTHKDTSQQLEKAGKEINQKLREYLRGKTYLVVLDDLRSITDWNCITDALPDYGMDSKILVTTSNVVLHPDISPLKLGSLIKEKSEELFCLRVFGTTEFQHGNKGRAQRIVRKSKYKPLAIVVLAGLLRSKDLKDWEDVVHERISNKLKPMESILSFSFDYLPHRLKSCFLYFSAFEEDSKIDAHRLVRLWIAEGFIQQKRGKTMEELGQEYLKELISRCMIQLVEKDINENIVAVSIHEHLLTFARSEAQEASFLEVHDDTDVFYPATVRRLSLQNGVDKYLSMRTLVPKLRSLLCDVSDEPDINPNQEKLHMKSCQPKIIQAIQQKVKTLGHLFSKEARSSSPKFTFHGSKFLRVIDLKGVKLEKLPNEIGGMIHLRYLGLKNTGLRNLPSSIRNLGNLQTLDITRTTIKKVADEFWQIQTLRHVLADEIFLPKVVSILNNLQTLQGVAYSSLVNFEKFPNLRYLKMLSLSCSSDKKELSVLEKLENLLLLDLRGNSLPFIPSLQRLQTLKLSGNLTQNGDIASSYETFVLPNLTTVTLVLTKVGQEFIHMLAKQPYLAELILGQESFLDKELLFPANGFRKLKKLEIANLHELVKWKVDTGAMSDLEYLSISNCTNLEKMDGMLQLRNLKYVELHNMKDTISHMFKNEEKGAPCILCTPSQS